ncbi:MAG: ABC transporter permease [Candidatus Aminicenantes bacterium]|nr:ABC transporter permease [Candidatus Aminicenantes bacterium]
MKSIREVFAFYAFYGRKTRRTLAFLLIALIPVAIATIFRFRQAFEGDGSYDGLYLFTNVIMTFFLQFLVLILTLFFGTSVLSEEVEGRTLTYLVTRPVSKAALLVGKYLAYSLIVSVLVWTGLVACFLILCFARLGEAQVWMVLLRYLGVLTLGILAYGAFFTFLGSFLKKSIMVGLIFSFGWENVIQYFPGSTQRFAIVHYLKSLLPGVLQSRGRFSFLTFRLNPTSWPVSILTLLLITAGFLTLAVLLFQSKEYNYED